MKKRLIIAVIAAVIAGVGFYGGMLYGQNANSGNNAAPANLQGQGGGYGRGARIAGGQNSGFVNGQLIGKDQNSITVKLRDGSSKIVFYSNSTKILKSVQGAISDLTNGSQLVIIGTADSSGNVIAQSIQLRPDMPQTQSQDAGQ